MVSNRVHLILPVTGFKAYTVPKLNGRFGPRTKRSHALAGIICSRIANGESLRSICRDPEMPDFTFVWKWRGLSASFNKQYLRAGELRTEKFADEIVEISDTEPDPAKARNRIEARKWVVSKLLPKVYGDKPDVQVNVGVNLSLPEQDRLALIERREKLLAAQSVRTLVQSTDNQA